MFNALLAPLLSLHLLCDTTAPGAPSAEAQAKACAGQFELAGRIVRVIRTAGPSLRTDTLVVVQKGMSLELTNFSGVINVNAWERDAVRVQAEHSRRDRIVFGQKDKTLLVEAENRQGLPSFVNYYLTVPQWMPLQLSGINAEIAINNVNGKVNAESVSGDVLVRGTSGALELSSIEGTVRVMDAKGSVEATSVNNDVRLERIAGTVSVESVNGSIRLEQLTSHEVSASSMNGTVVFLGDFKRKGRYAFTSHMGNIVVGVPEDAELDVSVINFLGGFRTGFPLRNGASPKRGAEFNFTLGSGGSSLDLESYQGLIQLMRPIELKAKLARLAAPAPLSPRLPGRPQAPTPPVPVTPEHK
ncbi:MAG: DUF4097 family beta strand repeat-containing protein [Candidatus Eisenbacteria bacterium]